MKPKIIIFSGLGADFSVFSRLNFDKYEVHFAPWIEPLSATEALADYLARMAIPGINPEEDVVIGLSFGGILALELASKFKIKKVGIISSISGRKYLPEHLKLVNILKLHRWFPLKMVRKPTALAYWFFGLKKPDEKELLKNIIGRMSENYFRWSTNTILNYSELKSVPKHLHIHGDKDRVLPLGSQNCDFIVQGGGHFMVYTHAELVQTWLDKFNN